MSAHNFDINVVLSTYKQMAGADLSRIERELDFRQRNSGVIGDQPGAERPLFAGSLTCGNTCGILSGCDTGGGSQCNTCSCHCPTDTCVTQAGTCESCVQTCTYCNDTPGGAG